MKVQVQEEYTEDTGGHYQCVADYMDIPATVGLYTKDVTFPHNIALYAGLFSVDSESIGDRVWLEVAPDTIVGALSANVAVNDTVINVSQTVVDNCEVGYLMKLDDGTNASDLGRVLAKDVTALTITVETPAANAHLAATPTYCKMTVRMISEYKFGHGGTFEPGHAKIGGSFMPANTVIRFNYDNITGTAKKFSYHMEYTY